MIEGLKREKVDSVSCFVDGRQTAKTPLWRTEAISRQSSFLICTFKRRNQLISHVNYDPENLTKQTDTDLHNMQEQVFAGVYSRRCWHAVQEQALEDISDTLGRLHDIGSAIGNEVDIQTVGKGEGANVLEVAGRDGEQYRQRAEPNGAGEHSNEEGCKEFGDVQVLQHDFAATNHSDLPDHPVYPELNFLFVLQKEKLPVKLPSKP